MKTRIAKMPERAEDLTLAQLQSLAEDAGLDPQVVERLIQKQMPAADSEALALRSQLFDGFMMIGGRWVQPTAADVAASKARANTAKDQAIRELSFADSLEFHLMLTANAERRAREPVVADTQSVETNVDVANENNETPSSADYS